RKIQRQRVAGARKRQKRRRPDPAEALEHGKERTLPGTPRRVKKRRHRLARRSFGHDALMLEKALRPIEPVPVANAVEREEKPLVGRWAVFRRAPFLPAIGGIES